MEELYFFENVDQVQATAEPTRWQILNLLIPRAMTGSQLARVLGIPRPLAHYHLQILAKVGLVRFEEERLRGGVVEKYYRSIARQYRTDHLVDRYRQARETHGEGEKTRKVVNALLTTMLEVARADIAHADNDDPLARAPFNYQDDFILTSEQTQQCIETLRGMIDPYIKMDTENRLLLSKAENPSAFHHVRLTMLMTPVTDPSAALEISPEVTKMEEILTGEEE